MKKNIINTILSFILVAIIFIGCEEKQSENDKSMQKDILLFNSNDTVYISGDSWVDSDKIYEGVIIFNKPDEKLIKLKILNYDSDSSKTKIYKYADLAKIIISGEDNEK